MFHLQEIKNYLNFFLFHIPKEKFLIVHGETEQRKEQVKEYIKALKEINK